MLSYMHLKSRKINVPLILTIVIALLCCLLFISICSNSSIETNSIYNSSWKAAAINDILEYYSTTDTGSHSNNSYVRNVQQLLILVFIFFLVNPIAIKQKYNSYISVNTLKLFYLLLPVQNSGRYKGLSIIF